MFKKLINKIKLWLYNRRIKKKIHQIEKKVLGFKLHQWQVDFILMEDISKYIFSQGRATGKTLAWDLRYLLRIKYPTKLYNYNSKILDDQITEAPSQYRRWHYSEIRRLYHQITSAGISLAKIDFKSK